MKRLARRGLVLTALAAALCLFCAACGAPAGEPEPSPDAGTSAPAVSGELAAEPAEGELCVFVSPTEAGGELRCWVPEDQTELAALFAAAREAEEPEYSIEPGVQELRLGVRDAEGYYWAFLTDGSMATTISAWGLVPAQAAAPLREYVETALAALGLGPAAEPGEISGLASATLRNFCGGDFTLTDPDALGQIEALLAASEPVSPGSCGFDMYLELVLESGDTLTLGAAQDGCPVWQSEGRYYIYPAVSNAALCSWFAPEPISAMTAAELLDSPLLAHLDWAKYERAAGSEETLALMRELGEAAGESEEAAAKFLGARLGLDGACSEAYTEALYGLYQAAPENLARAWEGLGAAEREDTLLRLAFRMDMDADEVGAELGRLADAGRRLYSAEGFGEDGFALLLTEEQPDGTLDFTLRFCEGWGETGDHYAEDSLSAVSASGTAQADGSFTARLWGQELSGELSLSAGRARLKYLGLSVGDFDFTDTERPFVPNVGPCELAYNIYLPVDFRERSLSEYEELLYSLPYFADEEELPVPTWARPFEIFAGLGLPERRWNGGMEWSMTYPQTVLSGRGSEPYLVEYYRSTDPEQAPRLRGIEIGDSAQELVSRFPNRFASFEELLEAARGEGGATFYGSGEPFYGDHGGMSLTEEEGGVISFFSAGVGVIFRLDAQLRVASIERYEVA